MANFDITASCILIVDDQELIVDLLTSILEAEGYHNVVGITDPRLAKALCLDDGERTQVEMSNVRRTTNVHSVAAGAQSAGLVYAARRLPTLRVPI